MIPLKNHPLPFLRCEAYILAVRAWKLIAGLRDLLAARLG
jgi:hypothetical protein